MNQDLEMCSVGECTREATRRMEIRRNPTDEHPAEVRALCSSPICQRLAYLSAAAFAVMVKP